MAISENRTREVGIAVYDLKSAHVKYMFTVNLTDIKKDVTVC